MPQLHWTCESATTYITYNACDLINLAFSFPQPHILFLRMQQLPYFALCFHSFRYCYNGLTRSPSNVSSLHTPPLIIEVRTTTNPCHSTSGCGYGKTACHQNDVLPLRCLNVAHKMSRHVAHVHAISYAVEVSIIDRARYAALLSDPYSLHFVWIGRGNGRKENGRKENREKRK